MVIAILMLLIAGMALVAFAAGRLVSAASRRRAEKSLQEPSHQIQPKLHHAPLVDSSVYS